MAAYLAFAHLAPSDPWRCFSNRKPFRASPAWPRIGRNGPSSVGIGPCSHIVGDIAFLTHSYSVVPQLGPVPLGKRIGAVVGPAWAQRWCVRGEGSSIIPVVGTGRDRRGISCSPSRGSAGPRLIVLPGRYPPSSGYPGGRVHVRLGTDPREGGTARCLPVWLCHRRRIAHAQE